MYGSTVWYPNRLDLKLIEGVQRRATKFILNDYNSDYKERLAQTKLLPLSFYKEYRDMCFIYKGIHGYYKIDLNDHLTFQNTLFQRTKHSQNKNEFKIRTPMGRTERRAAFFFIRIVIPWNSIPSKIRLSMSTNKHIWPFRKRLLEYYDERVKASFLSENLCTWVTCCRCPICRPV